jgi:hypothetical protein
MHILFIILIIAFAVYITGSFNIRIDILFV